MANFPFTPLPCPEEMNRWDRATADEAGISSSLLRDNAGRAAFELLALKFGSLADKKILVFMGQGNNGGDGAVLARLALNAGAKVLVCHIHSLPEEQLEQLGNPYNNENNIPAALLHVGLAKASGVEFHRLSNAFASYPEPHWEYPDIVVDALLGTGFKGNLRNDFVALVKRINFFRNLRPSNCACGCDVSTRASDAQWPGLSWPSPASCIERADFEPFVLSLDIPSGLCGTTGNPMPIAVAAHATVTFEAPKPGLLSPAARPYIGRMHVAPVGIPKEIKQRYPASQALLMPDSVAVTPNPFTFEHKNMAGKVLIIGGSPGMSGAPYLAALAAFRAGAGRVAAACPAGLESQIKTALPDMLSLPLGEGLNWTEEMAEELMPSLKNWDAIVLGPGMGTSVGSEAAAAAIIKCAERPPLLADADALNIIAKNPELLPCLGWNDLITPHPGEAARMLNMTSREVNADRLEALKSILKQTRAAVILKGPASLIGQSDRVALSPFIEPNLALAGSGDVLSGLIAAYLALNIPCFDAAGAGVYLHGMAGRLLRQKYPLRGNLPSEIAGILPEARLALADVPAEWVPDLNDGFRKDLESGNAS